MTSSNVLAYRVFQRDELIAAFLQHDEAVTWCKDVCERTITTFPDFKPVDSTCVYTVKRYERVVFTCSPHTEAKKYLEALRDPNSEGPR